MRRRLRMYSGGVFDFGIATENTESTEANLVDSTKWNKGTLKVMPVVETMAADLLTPLAVYLKLAETSEHSFLLESVEGGRQLARYSFIGANPVEVVSGGRE